jgi:uncharacterized protein (TIGR03000 family)
VTCLPIAAAPPGGSYNGVYIGGNPGSGTRGDSGIYIGGPPQQYIRGYDGVYIGNRSMPGTLGNPGQGYDLYPSVYPPVPRVRAEANTATIVLRTPQDAEVWFQGQKMPPGGGLRRFQSPPLARGKEYSYDIRARWTEDGRTKDETRRVPVHAGDQLRIDLPRSARRSVSLPASRAVLA